MTNERRIEPHERPLGKLTAMATGDEFVPYASLEHARQDPDAAVVFEGDSGGQVYATCPIRLVSCDAETLVQLGEDLDALGWHEPEDAGVFFQRLPVGSPVPGGMGGGAVVDGLWVHDDIDAPDLRADVMAVLEGKRDRIDLERVGRVLWTGPVTDDWTFAVPLAEHPISSTAAYVLDVMERVLQEARPQRLDRARSELSIYGFGWTRCVLAHVELDLQIDIAVGPGGLRIELRSGDVDFEEDLEPESPAFEDLVRALCLGRLQARPVFDEDGESVWYLRAFAEDDFPTLLGDTVNLDVFESRLGPIRDVPTLR